MAVNQLEVVAGVGEHKEKDWVEKESTTSRRNLKENLKKLQVAT
jgi:hypothetical protein